MCCSSVRVKIINRSHQIKLQAHTTTMEHVSNLHNMSLSRNNCKPFLRWIYPFTQGANQSEEARCAVHRAVADSDTHFMYVDGVVCFFVMVKISNDPAIVSRVWNLFIEDIGIEVVVATAR